MESESLKSGTLNFWKMQGAQKVTFSILNLSSQMHFWSQLWPGGHFDGCSASLKCKSESLTRKLQIWTRILTNHSLFIGNFKISMRIYENQLFSERQSKIWTRLQKIISFSKENWHRGGTEKIEKSAGRAASAIGVLRIFKSCVFAWRFFRLFWDSHERNASFQNENDIGEEPRPWRRGGTEKQKRPPGGPQVR